MTFDPMNYIPNGYQPTKSLLEGLYEFWDANHREPTPSELDAIYDTAGMAATPPALEQYNKSQTAPPLPDGYAGRDWNNPMHKWRKRIERQNS